MFFQLPAVNSFACDNCLIVVFAFVCLFVFCLGMGGFSNTLSGGGVRSPGEVGVLVGPPFGWSRPFGDG